MQPTRRGVQPGLLSPIREPSVAPLCALPARVVNWLAISGRAVEPMVVVQADGSGPGLCCIGVEWGRGPAQKEIPAGGFRDSCLSKVARRCALRSASDR